VRYFRVPILHCVLSMKSVTPTDKASTVKYNMSVKDDDDILVSRTYQREGERGNIRKYEHIAIFRLSLEQTFIIDSPHLTINILTSIRNTTSSLFSLL
jgi:hypothetical protein